MYSGIVYGHLYINCMDGRLFMETGKGLMNEAVYVLLGYESALMDNCQALDILLGCHLHFTFNPN